MKGPAISLLPFLGGSPPFDKFGTLAEWVSALGYRAVQLPTWDDRALDAEAAGLSDEYIAEIRGICQRTQIGLAALSVERQAWLLASNSAFHSALDHLAPEDRRASP